jgi:chromate transporter
VPAAVIGIAAAVALFRFKRGIMETVAGASIAGLALHFAGVPLA